MRKVRYPKPDADPNTKIKYKQNVVKNKYRIQVVSKKNPKVKQVLNIKAESEAKAKLLIPAGYEFEATLSVIKG